eukprot:6456323-Amphidinium_carterae.1
MQNLKGRWHPPEWLQVLAESAPLCRRQGAVGHEGHGSTRPVNGKTLEELLTAVGEVHTLAHYRALNPAGEYKELLLVCTTCGAYASMKRRVLKQRCLCPPSFYDRRDLLNQLHRMQKGQHPLAGARALDTLGFQDWISQEA